MSRMTNARAAAGAAARRLPRRRRREAGGRTAAATAPLAIDRLRAMNLAGVVMLVAAVALAGGARTAAAEPLVHRLSLAAGADVRLRPQLGGHGIVLVRYDLGGLPRDAHLVVDFNTDTLRVGVHHIRFAGGRLEAGASAYAELLIAGLLTDYIRNGISDDARGFQASYAGAGGYLKYGAG